MRNHQLMIKIQTHWNRLVDWVTKVGRVFEEILPDRIWISTRVIFVSLNHGVLVDGWAFLLTKYVQFKMGTFFKFGIKTQQDLRNHRPSMSFWANSQSYSPVYVEFLDGNTTNLKLIQLMVNWWFGLVVWESRGTLK